MAKPDCDDGWLAYAHELDAALALADFSKAGRLVLKEVFSQIFGPARLSTAAISCAEIGGRVGRPRQYVDKGLREALASGALSRTPEGRFRFAKDYERWTFADGMLRLTAAEVVYCKHAPITAMSHKHATPNPGAELPSTNGLTHKKTRVNPLVDMQSPRVNQRVDAASTNGLTESVPPHTPLVGKENGDKISSSPTLVIESGADSFAESVPVEAFPTVEALLNWAARSFPADPRMPSKLGQLAGRFPLAWVHEALMRAELREPDDAATYVQKVLREWKAAGGPDGDLESKPRPRPVPTPGLFRPPPLAPDALPIRYEQAPPRKKS